MTIILAVDPNVVPHPHQLLDDIEESLQLIKDAALKRRSSKIWKGGLVHMEHDLLRMDL